MSKREAKGYCQNDGEVVIQEQLFVGRGRGYKYFSSILLYPGSEDFQVNMMEKRTGELTVTENKYKDEILKPLWIRRQVWTREE